MNKMGHIARRWISLLSAMVLLLGAAVIVSPMTTAEDVTVQVETKTYDIAVVYDNSGSMYQQGRVAWSQAKFAMEIFASMLNFDGENGDRLTIYPMNQTVEANPDGFDNYQNEWVLVDEEKKINDNKYKDNARAEEGHAITIQSIEDIDKISNMYTPYAGTTPYAQVDHAAAALKNSDKDVKWLIILTDGIIDEYKYVDDTGTEQLKKDELQNALETIARDIHVQYLFFDVEGKDAVLQETGNLHTAAVTSGDELKEQLVLICNRIFEREELTGNAKNGFGNTYYDPETKELELDLSMKKLIVFAQGKDCEITGLVNKDAAGTSPAILRDSGKRSFSEIATGRTKSVGDVPFGRVKWDDTLAGQVVTFDACEVGDYTLQYSGTPEKIQVFYEPDIKLSIKLYDADGVEKDLSSGKLQAGTYTLKTQLVDARKVDKNSGDPIPVTDHPLIGNVKITTKLRVGNGEPKDIGAGEATFTLDPSANTSFLIEAEYLKIYKISSDDMADGDLPWPKGGFTVTEDIGFRVEVEQAQPNGEYKLNDMENWQPFCVTVKLRDGDSADIRPMTAGEMANVKDIKVEFSNGMAYTRRDVEGKPSTFEIVPGLKEDGTYAAPPTGEGDVTVTVTYIDPRNGEEFVDSGKQRFNIKTFEYAITATVGQDDAWYALSERDSWKPVRVDMTVDGRPLTDEELESVVLTVTPTPSMSVRTEKLPGQSAVNVYIGEDAEGKPVDPETEDYTLSIAASVTDKYGNSVSASAESTVEVHSVTWLEGFLRIAIPILLILLIILWFMTRKALPKKIGKDPSPRSCYVNTLVSGRLDTAFVQNPNYQRGSGTITLGTTRTVDYSASCSITLQIAPVDRRYVKSKDRSIQIVGISSNCKTVTISGVKYAKTQNGVWARADVRVPNGGTPPPISQITKAPNITAVKVDETGMTAATFVCKLRNL